MTKFKPTSKKYQISECYFDTMSEAQSTYSWVDDLVIESHDKTREEWLFRDHDTPIEFRSVLSYMAYERGHSAGEDEVFNILSNLVSELKPAIEAYTTRIKK